MTPNQAKIVAEALTWIGTPYHHCADVKGAGVDCAMILVRVFHAAGLIPAIDPRPYPTDWHLHRSEERYLGWIAQYGEQVPAGEEPQPGDIVIYKVGRCFSHAGIVLAWPEIAHAFLDEHQVVRGRYDAGRLAGKETQVWRVRGAAE